MDGKERKEREIGAVDCDETSYLQQYLLDLHPRLR